MYIAYFFKIQNKSNRSSKKIRSQKCYIIRNAEETQSPLFLYVSIFRNMFFLILKSENKDVRREVREVN